MSIPASKEKRGEFAAKIEWLEDYKNHDTPNRRDGERFAPAITYSNLIFADGSGEACLVIDLSVSGAGISADTVPDIKTVLAVEALSGESCATSSVDLPFSSSNARAATPSRPW